MLGNAAWLVLRHGLILGCIFKVTRRVSDEEVTKSLAYASGFLDRQSTPALVFARLERVLTISPVATQKSWLVR